MEELATLEVAWLSLEDLAGDGPEGLEGNGLEAVEGLEQLDGLEDSQGS